MILFIYCNIGILLITRQQSALSLNILQYFSGMCYNKNKHIRALSVMERSMMGDVGKTISF